MEVGSLRLRKFTWPARIIGRMGPLGKPLHHSWKMNGNQLYEN